MRTVRFAIIGLLLLALAPSASGAADEDRDGHVLRIERWLKAVLRHQPGQIDDASREVAGWSNANLRALNVDAYVLAQLMRDPTLRTIQLPGPSGRSNPRLFPYTDWQIRRLRVLACAAAGALDTAPCARIDTSGLDDDLRELARVAGRLRGREGNHFVLRHAALLHTDVATSGPEILDALDTDETKGAAGRLVVQIVDGQETNAGRGATHWETARMLLDAVKTAARGPDDMTRRWYVATAAWLQNREKHDTEHLRHAREMFPSDADIQFLSGCQQEIYAGSPVQAAVRSAVLPGAFSLDVQTESAALRDAEAFFRRALSINPSMAEARLRLGHVLLARGKAREAAEELSEAERAIEEPLRYYAALFLGAAREALGQQDEARESYARAVQLVPRAQSPYLALSAMAMRRGDRAAAVHGLEPMFALPAEPPGRDDPWWIYYVVQARNADKLLGQVYAWVAAAER